MNRWVRIDHRYKNPYRLTAYAHRQLIKWPGLVVGFFVLLVVIGSRNSGLAGWVFIGGIVLATARITLTISRRRAAGLAQQAVYSRASQGPVYSEPATRFRFNPPDYWPVPSDGWTPPPGWQPDPTWPPLPVGWQLWVLEPARGAPGERNTRTIPQDVKIAVSHRDQGRCVQCGSSQDLHFDHKIPWSKGGANTVGNIQLLCGPCNRRKGAEDIPATW